MGYDPSFFWKIIFVAHRWRVPGIDTIQHARIVVFTWNRFFYPTTSVHPMSVPIIYPREIQTVWSQDCETEKSKTIKNILARGSRWSKWNAIGPCARTQKHNTPDKQIKTKATIKQNKFWNNAQYKNARISERLLEEKRLYVRAEERVMSYTCCTDELINTKRDKGRENWRNKHRNKAKSKDRTWKNRKAAHNSNIMGSRICYEADSGTLPHHLPPPFYSR